MFKILYSFFECLTTPQIDYSDKYMDKNYEYRHVSLDKPTYKKMVSLPSFRSDSPRLLREEEWRWLGVQQSRGWEHYLIHKPEPYILLFRRPLGTDPATGAVDEEAAAEIRRSRPVLGMFN